MTSFDKPGTKSSSTISAKSDSTEDMSQPSSSGSSSANGSTMVTTIGDKSTTSLIAKKVLSQSIFDTNIFSSVVKAKIIWSLFSVYKEFSNNSGKYLNQKFQLQPDKLKYVIYWGRAPQFKDLFKRNLQNF